MTRLGLEEPIVSTFVDDIKIMGPKITKVIAKVKTKLAAIFKIVDIGPISFYLDLKIKRNQENRAIKLFQPAYIQKVLTKYHLDKANPTNTPIKEIALRLEPNLSTKATQAEKKRYQGITGLLIFSIVEIRPNIAFSITVTARFAKNLSHSHFEVIKSILRYFKGSINCRITYGREKKLIIERYSDSDWAGNKKSRKSILGFIFLLNGGPISWYSKK